MAAGKPLQKLPLLRPQLHQDVLAFFHLGWTRMEDGKQFLIGHRFNHADGEHQTQAHGQPVSSIQPIDFLHPSEKQMFHIGGSGQQQQSPAKPFFQVLFQFLVEVLKSKNPAHDEAKNWYGNQPDQHARNRPQHTPEQR